MVIHVISEAISINAPASSTYSLLSYETQVVHAILSIVSLLEVKLICSYLFPSFVTHNSTKLENTR